MNTQPTHLNTLTTIQFNANNASYSTTWPFFDSLNPRTQHIIAIQEPQISTTSQSTYAPPGYHLLLGQGPYPRVAFLISKSINVQTWEWRDSSENLASLMLNLPETQVYFINMYNPSPATKASLAPTKLPQLQRALTRVQDLSQRPESQRDK